MPFLAPVQMIFEQLPAFVLVLFRLAGLMAVAPMFGSLAIPFKIKTLLTLTLAFLVFPLVPHAVVAPNNLLSLAFAVGGEMLIGIIMGFALSLLFLGIQIGAELVGQQMGLSLAQVVDPFTQVQANVLSEFYTLFATMIYLMMNGHLMLIRSLVDTFHSIPLLTATSFWSGPATAGSQGLVPMLGRIISNAFVLGIRVAGPALIAIFLATLALGFISRTMPQLNILAAGFPVRITLALLLLVASLGGVGLLFKEQLALFFRTLGHMFNYVST